MVKSRKGTVDVSMLLAARVNVAHTKPYFSTPLFRLRFVAVPGLGTFAVDKYWRMLYDPNLDWDIQTTCTVLVHEMGHLIRGHAARAEAYGGSLIPELFNLAADAEINDDMLDTSQYTFPFDPITPARLVEMFKGPPLKNGLLAEQYYDYILQHIKTINVYTGSGHSDGDGKPGSGKCGSCAHGKELTDIDDPNLPPGLSEAEATLVRHQTAKDIEAHSKTQGSVPAGLVRWAKAQLSPKINWRAEITASVRWAQADVSGCVDYSYKRPSRRQGAYGNVVQPSMRKPIPALAVLFDTSGSMGSDELARGWTEIRSCIKTAGVTSIPLLSCDAKVHAISNVLSSSEDLQLFGGGGTDMCIGIDVAAGKAAMQNGKRMMPPDILVVVTDGFTDWPKSKPSTIKRVIVVLVSSGTAPSWADRVIKVPTKES